MWAARLLPFSELLSQKSNPAEIEDVVLSLTSELPSSKFVTDLLALNFPGSCSGDGRYLAAKLKRLLSRLRSTDDDTPLRLGADKDGTKQPNPRPEPLSVRYQTISQMIVEAHKSLDISVGKFRTIPPATTDHCSTQGISQLHETALQVGSFLFEHDTAYLSFLDTLLSVVVGQTEESSKIPMQRISSSRVLEGLYHGNPESPVQPPYLGSYLSKMAATPEGGVGCWERVLPLLTALHTWSQTSTSATTVSQQASKSRAVSTKTLEPGKSSQMKFAHRHSPEVPSPALRVNISIPFILNCLRNDEDKVAETTVRSREHCGGPEGVQSEMPAQTRKRSTVTPGIPDGDASRSLCLADLDTSVHAPPLTGQRDPQDLDTSVHAPPLTGQRDPQDLDTSVHAPPLTGQRDPQDLETSVHAPPLTGQRDPQDLETSVHAPPLTGQRDPQDLDTSVHAPLLTGQHEPQGSFPHKQGTSGGESIPSRRGIETDRSTIGGLPGLVLLQVPQGVLQVRLGIRSVLEGQAMAIQI